MPATKDRPALKLVDTDERPPLTLVGDEGVKKKEDTKIGGDTPSIPSDFKFTLPSGAGTSAKEGSGALKDFSSPQLKQQQESLALKKKMFYTVANKKLNIERKKAIEPKLTELGDKIAARKKEINDANNQLIEAKTQEQKDAALQKKAELEKEHDLIAQGYNNAAKEYNIYNKAVVEDEKLNKALLKVSETQPKGASSVSAASIFGKSFYNATLPALVKSLGTSLKVVGEVGQPEIMEGLKPTDKVGDALRSWGESLKQEIPVEGETDIWEKPTIENVTATAGNLIGTLATVIGTGGVGGAVAAGATGMALGIDESYTAAKEAGLSDRDAAKISLPIGIINGMLDVVGVGTILQGFEKEAINKALAKEAINYLKDKEITQASAIEAANFAQKEVIKQAAEGAFKTAAKEAATGSAQASTQMAGEEIYDVATDQDKFKNTAKGALIDIGKNALLEAAGGGIAGGVFSANPDTRSIYDKVEEITSDKEGMQTFLDELDSHVRAGEITEEQGENVKRQVESVVEANKAVPPNISDKNQRIQAVDLVNEKNKVVAEIEQTDPALLGDRKKTVSDIETMLKHIADGTQDEYTYKLNVDDGKYYQVDKSGKEEEITKQAFDLAIKYRKPAVPEAESKEGVKTVTDESNKKDGGGEEISAQVNAENVGQGTQENDGQKESLLKSPTGAVSPVTETLQTQITEEKSKENPDLAKIAELETQLKTEQDAIQEQTTTESVLRNEGVQREGELQGDERQNQPENAPAKSEVKIEEEVTGNTLAQTAEIRKEIGAEEYAKLPETQAEWEAKADKEIAKGYDAGKLLEKIDKGAMPSPVEQKILAKYIATQKAIVGANPTDENIAKLKKAIEISDKSAGTAVGKSLAARAGSQPVSITLADYFIEQMEASGVDKLTDQQKAQNTREFAEIQAAQIALEQKVAELEGEVNRLRAEQEVKGVKKTRKSREDFVRERKDITASIREKLKKSRGELSATPLPYAKELVIIAPDVVRLMRSYVEEGITKLSDITKAIQDEFKDDIPDLTEKDVTDIIAGKYSEVKKKTRNEIAEQIKNLRDEAALITKLESLEKGETPKSEKAKVERNKAIKDLQDKIKGHDLTKLSEAKTRIKNETEKLQKDLAEGSYQKVEKKELKLDKEALDLKDKLIKSRQERQVRLWKEEYENRSKYQKSVDTVTEILNVPRAIMSSMDFSAPLRQGLIQTISNPKIAYGAFKTMFEHADSAKSFDRWFYDLKESPEWEIMKKSGLYVADPHDPILSAKEEQFMTNLASKIPFLGTKLIKGSERAYVSYLNKMRVDIFKRYMDAFQSDKKGKTYENSPELYKAMADYINASTGRGNLGKLENAAQPLATLFFSPRLIASRLNLLTNPINPKFYATVPKEVKVAYFKDMAKFIGVGTMTLALAKLAGAEVEDDPRSSDFGKIKIGDTRYDIWGGFVQYVRLASQLFSGQTKNIKGKVDELDTKEHNRGTLLTKFARQKLAPLPATATNLITGYDAMGERADWKNELLRMLPLTPLDIGKAVKDEGIQSLFTVGVPSTFGIGVNRYEDKTFVKPSDDTITGVFAIKDYSHKNYKQKKIFISGTERDVTKEEEAKVNESRNAEAEKAVKKIMPELKKLNSELFKETVNIIYNQYEKDAKNKVFGDEWSNKIEDKKTEIEKAIENNKVRALLNSIPKFRLMEREEKIRKKKSG